MRERGGKCEVYGVKKRESRYDSPIGTFIVVMLLLPVFQQLGPLFYHLPAPVVVPGGFIASVIAFSVHEKEQIHIIPPGTTHFICGQVGPAVIAEFASGNPVELPGVSAGLSENSCHILLGHIIHNGKEIAACIIFFSEVRISTSGDGATFKTTERSSKSMRYATL